MRGFARLGFILAAIALVIHASKTDVFLPGIKDIPRTKAATSEIIRRAKGEPFTFALLSSRSFSDLHYQYFFRIGKALYRDPGDDPVENVFLACETVSCPPVAELTKQETLRIVCHTSYCGDVDPKISLGGSFIPVWSGEVYGVQLYHFRRQL